MRIRRAIASDAAALDSMLKALAAHEGYGDDTVEPLPAGGTTLVAVTRSGKVVGCVTVYPAILGVAEIWALFVEPSFRRRGIGRKLFWAVARRADTEVNFTVAEGNTLARKFYEALHCGFDDQP
jgi:ribosomal protein S18 acetylase RimI-like enzyme